MSEKEAKIEDQGKRIAELEAEVSKKDERIKELEAKCLRIEIDALSTFKDYDTRIAGLHTDLATLRGFAVAVKMEQHKTLAPEPKKG